MSSSTWASNPAEKKTICGAKSSSAGSQWRSTASRKPWLPVPAGERDVDHVRRRVVGAAVRIERVLEGAHHQHALVVGEDVLGAVAVVHVEVDDRDALEAVRLERVHRRDGDVVEDAEAHRPRARRVMPRRAHAAERALRLAAGDEIGGEHRRAGGAQRRIPGVRVHRGVGVEVHDAARRPRRADRFDVLVRMHPRRAARAWRAARRGAPGRPRSRRRSAGRRWRRGAPGTPGGRCPCRASCSRHG